MNISQLLKLLLLSILLSGCTIFPTAHNLEVTGTVLNSNGSPATNIEVSYADYKSRLFSMPSVGLHGTVRTNEFGVYRINLAEVHDTIDLTICGSSVLIDKSEWKSGLSIMKDINDCEKNH